MDDEERRALATWLLIIYALMSGIDIREVALAVVLAWWFAR